MGARTAVDVSLEVSPLPLRHRQEGSYAVAADLVKRTPAPEDSRALGLIGSPRALNPLIRAAQEDNDRDVRHSAQFAIEVIRTNLR